MPRNEPERLTEALRQSGGNLVRAARLLGMSRGGLRHRLHRYGLSRPSQPPSSPLAQVESGRGQVVGIVGEPGMGKSRLLAEWRQDLAAHEVTYLEGHCWSYGSATPYLPIIELLRTQCSITPDDSVGSITAKVRGQLQGTG